MTTITIENIPEKLNRTSFKNFEDLINTYYQTKNLVVLQQVKLEDLPPKVQQDIQKSKEKGLSEAVDFQG